MGGDGVGDGGVGGTGGVPEPVAIPVVSEIQVEYSNYSVTLSVFLQYELNYNNSAILTLSKIMKHRDSRGTGTGGRTCRNQNQGRILKVQQYSKDIFALRAGLQCKAMVNNKTKKKEKHGTVRSIE